VVLDLEAEDDFFRLRVVGLALDGADDRIVSAFRMDGFITNFGFNYHLSIFLRCRPSNGGRHLFCGPLGSLFYWAGERAI